MSHISLKPGTLLAPVPAALISVGMTGERGLVQNLMTAAWVRTVCSDPPMVSVSIRLSRYSLEFVDQSREFFVNLTDERMLWATDYCGVRSGRDEDKFSACGLTPVAVEGFPYAPAVAESPLCLGCKVRSRQELGSHIMFLGEVTYMGVRADLMGEDGSIRMQDAHLTAYRHGTYTALGDPLGFFGFSVASPRTLARRMEKLRGTTDEKRG